MTDASDVIVLADAGTRTERGLIDRWAASERPGADVVDSGDPRLVELVRRSELRVVPARVVWSPPERSHNSKPRPVDFLAMFRPRRPPAPVQQLLAQAAPGSAQVVSGEPARVDELRQRFAAEESESGEEAFAAYVARVGTLACERAARALIGDRYKVPRLVVERITASNRFRRGAEELATKLGRASTEVFDEAVEYLGELVSVQSPPAIDAFRTVLAPMHASTWDQDVDTENLERLRELNRKYALVFLPAHRSYADPLVLAEALYAHDFPRNHLIGGNNMAFWPIGTLGKRAGAIFIRRGGGDAIYKLALREYLGYLVSKRFNLEWYIEGGRSRTGKLRPPMFGLLKYLADAVEAGRAEDVMLVPVSMVYDRMYELAAMAAEQGGATKGAEGFGWLLRYIRGQRQNPGTAHVRFGTPLSLAGALSEAGDEGNRLEKIAFQICDGINRATPVTAVALVTFALLGSRGRALTLAQVRRVLSPFLEYLRRRNIPGPPVDLAALATVRETLDQLVESGVASCYTGGAEPVWSISEGQARVAAFHRNSAVHHFVTRAVVELALVTVADEGGSGDPVERALRVAQQLRELLKFDFFFAGRQEFRAQVAGELELLDPQWSEKARSAEDASALLATSRVLVAPRAIRTFLESQLVVAEQLCALGAASTIDRESFLDSGLGVGWQMLLQGRLRAEDAVSKEHFSTALRLAEHRDLVEPSDSGAAELTGRRMAFRDEIIDVLTRLDRAETIEGTVLHEVLHES